MEANDRLVLMLSVLLFVALFTPLGVSAQFLLDCPGSNLGCQQRCIADTCEGGGCHIDFNVDINDDNDDDAANGYNFCHCYGCVGQYDTKLIKYNVR